MSTHPFYPPALARPARLGLLIGALACAAGAAYGQASKPAAPADAQPATPAAVKPALTVNLVQPQRTNLAQTVQANGSIHAWQDAVVGAEGSGWRLAEVRVNVGDWVRRGQVLATFAVTVPQAELAQTEAQVAEAEATLAEAAANAQRARDLQPSGVLSAQQTNQILTAERTAQARVQAQRAVLKVQQLRLQQARVLAPDDGVISVRSATVGAVVPPGTELFRLIRQGRLEWRAEVAATDLARLAAGQSVRVQAVGGPALVGTVRMVAPTLDPQTRNALVYVDLPGALNNAAASTLKTTAQFTTPTNTQTPALNTTKAGMFARGEFEVGSSTALTLPQTAVLLRDGFSYVFTLGAADRVTQTKVQVGRRVGERIEITSGLEAGARVVASGAGFLSDGDTVRVVAAAAAASTTPAATAPR